MNQSRSCRGWSCPLLLVALCLVVGLAVDIRPAVAADETAVYPENRLFTNIVWHPAGERRRVDIVAINPENGACEIIAGEGTGPRLSPDHRRLAYVAMERPEPDAFKQRCSVWIRPAGENAEPEQIWIGDGNANICWERGGQHVIVAQYERSADGSDWIQTNWRVDVVQPEAEMLELPENDGVTDAAHHSDRIIAWRLGNRKIQLVTMSYEGDEVAALTQSGQYDYNGRFSPDDEQLLFLRRQKSKIGVYTSNADGKNPRLVYNEKGLTEPEHAAWSPDGQQLAVVLFDWPLDEQGRKVRRGDDDANVRIAIMARDGSNFRELTLDRDVHAIGKLDWR